MEYSNFKKSLNNIIIIKLLLCLYIFSAVYLQNDTILKIVNDEGIKIILLLLIIYLVSVDYTLSLLVAIALMISIVLYNKNNIETIRKLNKIENDLMINNKDKSDSDNESEDSDVDSDDDSNDHTETNDINNNIAGSTSFNIDSFIEQNLNMIQNNVFKLENNNLYTSGNYNTPFITTQGRFEINK